MKWLAYLPRLNTWQACMVYLVLKPGSQHWGLCILCESENHVKVGPVSVWDVKEPLRMTSTLCASIERSA